MSFEIHKEKQRQLIKHIYIIRDLFGFEYAHIILIESEHKRTKVYVVSVLSHNHR